MYRNHAPTLKNLVIKVISQTTSFSACERNWSIFALIHTKQRNRLAYPRLQQLVFCYYDMKLKIRDMQVETDEVAENNYLDLLDILAEFGKEEDNQLFQWVRPLHFDDEDGNLDPQIAAHVREAGVEVDRVLSEEVHSESFSQDTKDSFQHVVASRPSFDSSAEPSSRPSFAGTSTTCYDGSKGEGTNDGSDTRNDGGDIANRQISQYQLSSFTGEDDFTHATQDEDHGSRRVGPGIGVTRKLYKGRQRRMTHHNEDSLSASFESMSIGTPYSDSSNDDNIFPPYTISYGHHSSNPSASIDEEYGMINYSHAEQMSFHIPYQMQQGFQTNMWVNPEFPIHGEVVGTSQDIYA